MASSISKRDVLKYEQMMVKAAADFLEYQELMKSEMDRKAEELFGSDYDGLSVSDQKDRRVAFVAFYKALNHGDSDTIPASLFNTSNSKLKNWTKLLKYLKCRFEEISLKRMINGTLTETLDAASNEALLAKADQA